MVADAFSRRRHRGLRRGVEIYLDGEATVALAVEVRRHLAQCWSCSEDAEWQLLVKASLVRAARDRVPELSIARLGRFAGSLAGQP